MDPKRHIDFLFGLIAVLTALVSVKILQAVWDFFQWPLMDQLGVSMPVIVGMALGLAVFFIVRANKVSASFFQEVLAELSKVTYPARKETIASAVVVIIMLSIASVIMIGFDTLWGTTTSYLLAR